MFWLCSDIADCFFPETMERTGKTQGLTVRCLQLESCAVCAFFPSIWLQGAEAIMAIETARLSKNVEDMNSYAARCDLVQVL